jgi:hypothetical protein
MRLVRIVPALLLFFMLGSQILSPRQAEAWCCPCGSCMWWMGCTCPGYFDSSAGGWCGSCRSQNPDGLKVSGASMDERVPDLVALTVTNADITPGIVGLMQGRQCFRNKMALGVLGNAGEGLRFEPIRFNRSAS